MHIPDAFTIDERYDRVHASDRRSRYGVYLAQRAGMFRVADDQPTADAAEFAAAALEVGMSPIMSPPYVGSHRRILYVGRHRDEDGRTAISLELAAPLPAGLDALLGWHWRGWCTSAANSHFYVSCDNDRPTAVARLALRIPLDARRLPEPRYHHDGTPQIGTAKEAVQLTALQLNGVLGELLTALTSRRAA